MYCCIADFEFRELQNLEGLKSQLEKLAGEHPVLGTVLLAHEGINLNLAVGPSSGPESLKTLVRAWMKSLAGLGFELSRPRLSKSEKAPFKYFEVQIRPEIVALKRQDVRPDVKPGQRIEAKELCRLLKEGLQPGTRILDVRNDYEWDYGHFRGAEKIGMNNFREFQDLAKNWNRSDNLIVYCTGGVRCEKAVTLLEAEGFRQIRQLDGGVLRYFEDCGGEAWEGDLFVFDDRFSIRPTDVLSSRELLSDGNSESGSS